MKLQRNESADTSPDSFDSASQQIRPLTHEDAILMPIRSHTAVAGSHNQPVTGQSGLFAAAERTELNIERIRKMKRYASIVIALLLTASLSACGAEKDTASVPAAAEKTESTAEVIKESSAPAEMPKEAAETVSNEKATESESAEEIPDEAGVEAEPESPEACEEAREMLKNEEEPAAEGEEVMEAADAAPENGFEVAGTYSLAAMEENGEITYADTPELRSKMFLKEDGTGTLTFNEDTAAIEKWAVDGTQFAMFYDEHGAADGTIDNGIIILDPVDNEDILFFYAQEGADITEVLAASPENYILED